MIICQSAPGAVHLGGEGGDIVHGDVRVGRAMAGEYLRRHPTRLGGTGSGEAAVNADGTGEAGSGPGERERGHAAEAKADSGHWARGLGATGQRGPPGPA